MMTIGILGIGNVLMGDDGIGPAVIRYLDAHFEFPDDVTVEDLGTPSLDLPNYLAGLETAIFIDAVAEDAPAGSIHTYTREQILAVPPGIHISPHEPSVNDALAVLDFAGTAPSDVLLIGVVAQTLDGGVMLSNAVATAVPQVAEVVLAELAARGVRIQSRETPIQQSRWCSVSL
ncbi:MAG TPA: hydrogenase maturation protease [Thermoanaerobaculia bacterium]|nr:hydrogenase maturation protease [Thermoanaerobaculia bacterium]